MNGAGVPPTDWKFLEEVQEGREGRVWPVVCV